MTRGLRRRPVDDTGASLILALAFMTFLGLVVASLLTYSGTSLRSTHATEAKAESTYDIDAALQAAINKVRTDAAFTNAPTEDCAPLAFSGPNTGAKLTVRCVGGKGTGAAGGPVEINDSNRPKNALLTLGTSSGETGIDNGSSRALQVLGDVYVHSRPTSIEQSGTGGMNVDGTLTAKGSCDGTIVATTKSCNNTAANPAGADPKYFQPPTDSLDYRAVPACGGGRTVVFVPGYYDDAVALTKLTNGTGCTGKTLHFRPGVYFFDFHNGDGKPLPAGPHVWTIDDASTDVVGGRPKGWTEATGNPTIPGACVSPLASDANGGVQFVFGGDSRLDVKAGKVELCGRYSTGRPPIALYGARTGADPDPVSVTAKTDGTGTSTGPAFTPPAEITEADSVPATAVIDGAAGEVTSAVTVRVVPPSPLPAGSIVTKAELFVWHRSDDPAGSTLKDLRVQYSSVATGDSLGAQDLTRIPGGPADAAYPPETLDVTSDLAGEIHRRGLTGLKVTYAATVAAGNATTENLDSIQLKLTYQPPAVRGQQALVSGGANCVGDVGGCAMITTRGSQTRLYVQGTTYAPLARLDVRLANVSAQVFSAGIIVRALKISITPSAALGADPTIAVPDLAEGGPPRPLEVYFRVYTCPDGLTCGNPAPSAPWRLSGSARVRFVDPDIFTPTAPYDTVTVLAWTVRET